MNIPLITAAAAMIGPLVTLNFGETGPYAACVPQGCVAGSSAVALAGALTVEQFPPACNSDTAAAYRWDLIAGGDFSEAARIIAHCGAEAGVEYAQLFTHSVPASQVADALHSLGYPSARSIARDSMPLTWTDAITAELEAGRPVIYLATDRSIPYTHTFIVDGHDPERNLWHINWGEAGADNGWYTLDNLRMRSMDVTLAHDHEAVVGIAPDPDIWIRSVSLTAHTIWSDLNQSDTVAHVLVNGLPSSSLWEAQGGDDHIRVTPDGALLLVSQPISPVETVRLPLTIRHDEEVLSLTMLLGTASRPDLSASSALTYDRRLRRLILTTLPGTLCTLAPSQPGRAEVSVTAGPDGSAVFDRPASGMYSLTLSNAASEQPVKIDICL